MKTFKKIFLGLSLLIGLGLVSLLTYSHKAAALSQSDFKNASYSNVGTTSITASLPSGDTIEFDNSGGNPLDFKAPLVFTPVSANFNGGQFCSGSKITMANQTPLPSTAQINVKWINTGGSGTCTPGKVGIGPQTYSGTIKLAAAGVPPPTSSTTPDTSCYANLNSSFSWLICPVLSLADEIIGAVYGQVEDQLCFNTGATSFTAGAACNSPNSLTQGVKTAWSIFKDIASALLVIVMLIMVFSQAIGGGPFDAYAIRKTLPKLVAAVILMQLSFVLLKWAIDLSNDVGRAIGSLMMAPFGGPKNMSLQALVGNGVKVATGGTGAGNGDFQFFAILAAIAGGVWAIPALPLLALYIVAGVFIAFFVLILRKLLIIMLVMLSPVALILWVLPGTDNYWRMWRTNLTKLLAMFPLIMAMLAAGRILAYITSQAGSGATLFFPRMAVVHLGSLPVPYFASATGFADLAIIVGAYFAPYFLLPKTFSWGGDLLKQAGRAVENITNRGAEPGKKFLKGREESYRAERRRKSERRYNEQKGFSWRRPQSLWQRPLDLARAGTLDPTLGFPNSRRRKEARTGYRAAGAKAEEDELANANAAEQLTIGRIHPDEQDDYGRALAAGQKLAVGANGRLEAERFETDTEDNLVTADGKKVSRKDVHTVDAHGNLLNKAGDTIGNMSSLKRNDKGKMLIDHNTGRVIGAKGAKKADLLQRRAGLDQITRLGGEGNIEYIQKAFERAMQSGNPDEIEMMNKFTTANVSTLFKKLPHLYKNNNYAVEGPDKDDVIRTVGGLNPEDVTALSGVGMKTLRDSLIARAHAMNKQAVDMKLTVEQRKAAVALRDDAVKGLQRLTSVYQAAASDPTLRGRIPAEVALAMHELAIGKTAQPIKEDWNLGETLSDISDTVDERGIIKQRVVQTPAQTQAPASGILNITHSQEDVLRQRAPTEKLATPDATGWTPLDYANAENQAHDEFNYLRGLGVRTPEQEARFQYYRSNFPNW